MNDQAFVNDVFGSRIKKFQNLMRFKIRDILLVSSLYDYYLFEEDGRLYELIREEYHNLNLSHAPEITHVTTGREAIELVNEDRNYDLILTTMHIEDMDVVQFVEELKENNIKKPIVLLTYDNVEKREFEDLNFNNLFDHIFIWQGDYKLLIGIIKLIEDKLNIENDTKSVGVQAIILVEDNIKFYSSYLPLIYTEIFNQSQRLISEGVNVTHRYLRMRARPKIILSTNYEDGWNMYVKYQEYVLGVILDINFYAYGKKDPEAGLKFAAAVKNNHEDIPILLQSYDKQFAPKAHSLGASFLQKESPRLLRDLREFMKTNFSFGDFIFKTPEGIEVGRASNLHELVVRIQEAPDESILYHSERNHFSNWLKARTEFWLANRLRPRKVEDFDSITELKSGLASIIQDYIDERQRGTTTEFSRDTFNQNNSFARIGGGSLGGKARGLGFINSLISYYDIRNKFKDVAISVPSAVVLATDVFEQFMDENNLYNFAYSEENDDSLYKKFYEAPYFPDEIVLKLKDFLDIVHTPLAIRSSSLLEDSQFQPFAGVYDTYMIPNNNNDNSIRLKELLQCIKGVYASTFSRKTKDYLKATSYRLEEEKMAVIIQKVVGAKRESRFYPDFGGVAKSYNFYPIPPQHATDGIAQVSLGLGKTVVDGGNTVRFCPKFPRHLLQFFSTKETIRNAQQEFYALDMSGKFDDKENEPNKLVKRYKLNYAEKDNTLFYVGSTYSPENDAVYDGISRIGSRIVTFAPILKHRIFPLPEILTLLLDIGTWGMGTHVEIEFAVNMAVPKGERKEFAMLQMRPLVLNRESVQIDFKTFDKEDVLISSDQVLGNGIIQNIEDIVVVNYHTFQRAKSKDTAQEVSYLNKKLISQNKKYLLVGVGRWGSFDHWLGIPVTWDQISGASVIVESGFKDFNVTPSQGSHFFQNITSFRIGYFTVNSNKPNNFINWEWLNEQPAEEELKFTKHIKLNNNVDIRISGSQSRGIILKPNLNN